MKRFTMIVALTVLMAMPMFAERVTPETACKVATTFLNNNGAKTTQLTDLSKAAGFPNLYIFSTENSFVVMSADDCVKPILGYSLTGSFDVEDIPDNVCAWLKGYSNEIGYAINSKISASAETVQLWKTLSEGKSGVAKANIVVSPIIETKWNQNKYYNDSCPAASGGPNGHSHAGCVATAMAQIMNHWQYPSIGIGSHSYTWNNQTLNANFGATPYDWNNMADTYNYYYNDNGIKIVLEENARTPEQIAAVATLMFHCGVSVDMSYGGGGSGAPTSNVANALSTYFNYCSAIEYRSKSNYMDDEWEEMVRAELDANRPLEYCGSDISSGVGHAFVCDGYDDADYFHFNWGWSGRYDGYFSLSNLNTGANNESGSGNGVYTTNQAAIFGIKPSSNNAVPTDLTYSLSGLQDVILNWTNSNGAISYNIYRNGILISNTTANTYTETAPFGTNIYYVRSVNSVDDLSLPSNLITITINYQQPIVDNLKATFSGNQVSLTWASPEWCYPETASATLTYGNGVYSNSLGTNGSSCVYWGHRYTTSTLANYSEMLIYKISFYASITGTYRCFIYNGTSIEGDNIHPQTQVTDTIITTAEIGWFDINLSENLNIDESQDLWVFMFDPEYKSYPVAFCNFTDNIEGSYYIMSNPLNGSLQTQNGVAWLIRTYLTDGTYTYNLYDNGIKLNGETPISDTSYTIENIENNTIHNYTIKTNYYGGESEASNTASLALGSNTLASLTLENNDNMTIGSGSTLTVTDALSNADAANLVLEDGAQLIHNSDGVAATVKKDIAAWTTEPYVGGWYFIASPINSTELAPDSVDNMLTDANEDGDLTYDLYSYNANEAKPWINYRQHIDEDGFVIANGAGYLYANAADQTLEFSGEIKPYSASANTVTLTNDGWNLIGNPFTCAVTVSEPFSELNNGSSVTNKAAGDPINPCAGIAVYGNANDVVTFTKLATQNATQSPGNLRITLEQHAITRDGFNVTTIDNAIVSFSENASLPKFTLLEANSELYIPQGDEEYAIVSAEAIGEMPLNFRAAEDGTYTLTVNPEGVEMNFLHLVDNLTGNNIDLLATPSYTFEAKTNDYVSRFRLVFKANETDSPSTGSGTFAYYADGEIHVIEMCHGASLQMVDMTGRVVYKGDAMNRVSMGGMTPGVYVLRLITADGMKTQKILID